MNISSSSASIFRMSSHPPEELAAKFLLNESKNNKDDNDNCTDESNRFTSISISEKNTVKISDLSFIEMPHSALSLVFIISFFF